MEGGCGKKILIAAVGGTGINMAKSLARELPETDIAAVDTDARLLSSSGIKRVVAVGPATTGGRGTEGDPGKGKAAAAESAPELEKLAQSSDLLILICGLGGGTGSMLAPIMAKLAGERTRIVCLCATPQKSEGRERNELARKALSYLRKKCAAAFELPDNAAGEHAAKAAAALARMFSGKGVVNMDFPTFDGVFSRRGDGAFIAYGSAEGADACDKAVEDMLKSPMLEDCGGGVESLLLSLTCGGGIEMNKMQYLLETAASKLNAGGKTAFAASVDASYTERVEICAMGTYRKRPIPVEPPPSPAAPEQKTEIPKGVQSGWEFREKTEVLEGKSEKKRAAAQRKSSPKAADTGGNGGKKTRIRLNLFGFGRGGKKRSTRRSETEKAQTNQREFKFADISEQRGFFNDTEKNMRNGVDLDVPTYMRRGIKIVL